MKEANTPLNISPEMTALINSMHNPVLVIDPAGNLIASNKAVERIIGRTKKELLCRPLVSILKGSRLHMILKTGRAESVQKITIEGKTYISNRTPVKIKDRIVGAMAVLQDVSELEHISSELKVTKDLSKELRAVIESSFDGIYVTDGKAVTLRVNKAYDRITGLKRRNSSAGAWQTWWPKGSLTSP